MVDHQPETVLVAVAHPDDETFGCGALIASAAAAGARVVVCCASRGELGEDASGRYPTPDLLGPAREHELRDAAAILGVSEIEVFGLGDSGWDGPAPASSILAEPALLSGYLDSALVRHRPDTVVTLDPTGSDGHRDHAAVGQAATESFARIVHWPADLYHWCLPRSLMEAWSHEIAAKNPDSAYLETELGRRDDDVTTVLDGADVLDRVWRAMACHATQASPYDGIDPTLAERFVRFDHLVRQTRARQGVVDALALVRADDGLP